MPLFAGSLETILTKYPLFEAIGNRHLMLRTDFVIPEDETHYTLNEAHETIVPLESLVEVRIPRHADHDQMVTVVRASGKDLTPQIIFGKVKNGNWRNLDVPDTSPALRRLRFQLLQRAADDLVVLLKAARY